jgi:hypothetical protein
MAPQYCTTSKRLLYETVCAYISNGYCSFVLPLSFMPCGCCMPLLMVLKCATSKHLFMLFAVTTCIGILSILSTCFLVLPLPQTLRAIADGADVRGFYYWTLVRHKAWAHCMDVVTS